MLNTQYLFGIEPEELEDKLYYDALRFKLAKVESLHSELYNKPNQSYEDRVRLHNVQKALRHTVDLIAEKEERE